MGSNLTADWSSNVNEDSRTSDILTKFIPVKLLELDVGGAVGEAEGGAAGPPALMSLTILLVSRISLLMKYG